MTQLGEMKKILRLCIQRDCKARILKISQGSYIKTILAHFKMDNANPVLTLLNKTMKLNVPELKEQQVNNEYFLKAIGSLMFAGLRTHPDIAFAIQH
jgi:hypothetical protein